MSPFEWFLVVILVLINLALWRIAIACELIRDRLWELVEGRSLTTRDDVTKPPPSVRLDA